MLNTGPSSSTASAELRRQNPDVVVVADVGSVTGLAVAGLNGPPEAIVDSARQQKRVWCNGHG